MRGHELSWWGQVPDVMQPALSVQRQDDGVGGAPGTHDGLAKSMMVKDNESFDTPRPEDVVALERDDDAAERGLDGVGRKSRRQQRSRGRESCVVTLLGTGHA